MGLMRLRGSPPALRDGGDVVGATTQDFIPGRRLSRREKSKIAQDAILGKEPRSACRPVGSARNVELARRIGATRQEVNRLTNLKHATKIDRIDAALRALGKRLYLDAA